MTENQNGFSSPAPDALLSDPQILGLFTRLRQLDPALLEQAASLAGSGDTAGARKLLMQALDTDSGEKRDSDGRF